jgi:FimV-like protein
LNIGDPNVMRALDDAKSRAFFREQRRKWDESLGVIGENDLIKADQDEYSDSTDSFASDSIADVVLSSSDSDSGNNFQAESSATTDSIVSGGRDDASAGEVVALRKQVTELQTSTASGLIENQELTQRLLIIERQLADMNRFMALSIEDAILTNEAPTLALAAQNDTDTEAVHYGSGKKLDDGSEITDTSSAKTAVNPEVADSSLAPAEADDTSVGRTIEPSTNVIEKTAEGENDKSDLAEKAAVASTLKTISTRTESNFVEKTHTFLFSVNSWKILAAILVGSLVLLLMRRKRADKELKIRMMSMESNSQNINDEQSPGAISISDPITKTMIRKHTELDKGTSFLSKYSENDAVVPADGSEFDITASKSIEIDLTDALDIDSIKFDRSPTMSEGVSVNALREPQELSDFETDGNYDDARTQYELAEMTFDLGDEDGARDILNDIVKNNKGSDEVLADVNKLLAGISQNI